MIIWLNGAFGAGKTTCAFELHRRLPNSFVYDPENIGFFLQKTLPPEAKKDDFQHYKMWRTFNYEIISYIARNYDGTIIIPMTITHREYYDEIIQRLKDDGILLRHFILYAERKTIEKRLRKRLNSGESWARAQIDRCLHSFQHHITEEKIITDDKTIDEIVEEVAERANLPLLPDKRKALKKWLDRKIVLFKHIRI